MRRLVSTLALLLAWCCANGIVWDGLQVFAWARMYSEYANYLPSWKAFEKTFDGSKPCEICGVAQAGHDQTARQQAVAGEDQVPPFVLCCETAAVIVAADPRGHVLTFDKATGDVAEVRAAPTCGRGAGGG